VEHHDIIAERIADNRKCDPFHVRRFCDRADAERYLDELVVRFTGNKGRDEKGERWSIREAGVVTRYSIELGCTGKGCGPMIDFPNHSRSYDSTRRAVRFWGHDSAIEASFYINEDALTRIQPDARPDEPGFLNAFDSNRDLICAAAAKVYVRGSRGSYDLVAANF
jgi:hypothetical protein